MKCRIAGGFLFLSRESWQLSLKDYNAKRDFSRSSEPEGDGAGSDCGGDSLRFVVHKHYATRLHYDLRLEAGGVFKSWAVPKGPGLAPGLTRLAVFVEDHPLKYGLFEGVIPSGNYGAGTVMIWDAGTVRERSTPSGEGASAHSRALEKGLAKGHITFLLDGRKLAGEFALIRTPERGPGNWILVKKRDRFSGFQDILLKDRSVASGRSMEEIAAESSGNSSERLPVITEQKLFFSGPFLTAPDRKPAGRELPEPDITEEKPAHEAVPRGLHPGKPVDGGNGLFEHRDWIFEWFTGGIKALAVVDNHSVRLTTGSKDLSPAEFAGVYSSLRAWKGPAVLEGEIVMKETSGGESPEFLVSDVLHLRGKNLRKLPLLRRKEILQEVSGTFSPPVQIKPWQEAATEDCPFPARNPCLWAKHKRSPWTPGVNRYWLLIRPVSPPRRQHLTHTDRIYWPGEGLTKGDLIEYYRKVSGVILPSLKDRPLSLKRYPHGIGEEGFYQKNMSGYLPSFVETTTVVSRSSGKSVRYLLCQNEETLIYMANLGCIDIHPWLATASQPDCPDQCVIDLDPDGHAFAQVAEVALCLRSLLGEMQVPCFCKTSGSRGLHVVIPLAPGTSFEASRNFALRVAGMAQEQLGALTSLERATGKRKNKIYLDCMQNRRSQTLAAPYSVRPVTGARVSAPVTWQELEEGAEPGSFTLKTMPERIRKLGDLWAGTRDGQGVRINLVTGEEFRPD